MPICTERSLSYLKKLNLNVILHPRENITPLLLLGERNNARAILGHLSDLVENPTLPLPSIEQSTASPINGQKSDKLPFDLGIKVMGSLIGAMGGHLDLKAKYEGVTKIEFAYSDVNSHDVSPMQVTDYLQSGQIRWRHPLIERFIVGEGKLYVLTQVVTSDNFTVSAYDRHGTQLGIEIPEIGGVAAGGIVIAPSADNLMALNFKGSAQLAFGFSVLRLDLRKDSAGADKLWVDLVRAGDTHFGAEDANQPQSPYVVWDAVEELDIKDAVSF